MDLYKSCLILLFLAESGLCSGGQIVMPAELSGVRGRSLNLTATVSVTDVQMVNWNFISKSGSTVPICTATAQSEKVHDPYQGRVTYYRDTYTLEIRSLIPSDSGTYTLNVVQNNLDQVVGQTRLEVLEPVADVSVTSTLSEAVEINSTVILNCAAKGSSLSYAWLNNSASLVVDGQHIVQNGSQLIIKEVYRTDLLGPISCTAKNQLESSTSAAFNLTVNYGPDPVTIKQEPSAAFLKKGSNLTLSCSAKSSPAAEFVWLFNGAELPQKNATVFFSTLAEDQTGNYSCMAHNSKTLRYITSEVVKLSVLEAISGTSISAPMVPLIAGNGTVNLTCTSSTGKADSVQWQKNGKALDKSERIIFSTDNSSVTILTVQKEDAGEYKCQLTNKINSDSNKYTLTVNYGPDNVAIKGDKQALMGHTVMINCSFASYPVPTFVWKFNDTVLHGETNNCLTITNLEYKNSGIYTCEASNIITGLKKSATHNLTVKEVEDEPPEGLSNGAIAGIIIAVLVLLAIIIGVCVHKRRKVSDVQSPY
ncbi:carcinoembryonic antigen-related cell adhesion molecule 5 [Hemibagrus wyckioides]|uniref:carcinoembryonic antigen-related cell adhesion molecule 5 n=1 Tax=Hemibagrus wyckioides TaxID=337641 RepID=UPI00266C6F58|nr:carcinoembryonic antigen-related cell adhesion molecule 5 [Hemibagrus wyckioides]